MMFVAFQADLSRGRAVLDPCGCRHTQDVTGHWRIAGTTPRDRPVAVADPDGQAAWLRPCGHRVWRTVFRINVFTRQRFVGTSWRIGFGLLVALVAAVSAHDGKPGARTRLLHRPPRLHVRQGFAQTHRRLELPQPPLTRAQLRFLHPPRVEAEPVQAAEFRPARRTPPSWRQKPCGAVSTMVHFCTVPSERCRRE